MLEWSAGEGANLVGIWRSAAQWLSSQNKLDLGKDDTDSADYKKTIRSDCQTSTSVQASRYPVCKTYLSMLGIFWGGETT